MRSVNLDEAEYYGSTPPANREAGRRECRHCGSQLAGRYKGVRFMGGADRAGLGVPVRPREVVRGGGGCRCVIAIRAGRQPHPQATSRPPVPG
jgi:hypothetical protein